MGKTNSPPAAHLQPTDQPSIMKLHLDNNLSVNRVFTFDERHILIGEQRFEQSVIVSPDTTIGWEIDNFEDLLASHFEQVLALSPEIVILGTGSQIRFPDSVLSKPLVAAQVGLEVMNTAAACRTYNVLADDRRKVVAMLLIEAG